MVIHMRGASSHFTAVTPLQPMERTTTVPEGRACNIYATLYRTVIAAPGKHVIVAHCSVVAVGNTPAHPTHTATTPKLPHNIDTGSGEGPRPSAVLPGARRAPRGQTRLHSELGPIVRARSIPTGISNGHARSLSQQHNHG